MPENVFDPKLGNIFKYETLPEPQEIPEIIPVRIGIAADHGGLELKDKLARKLKDSDYEVIDFGNDSFKMDDDYPDYVVPLAKAVANREVFRGIAVCGSGVGACVAANKIKGVRASLITESFSAHQGVEDDDMNIICLGGRVIAFALAWELVKTFITAKYIGAERHRRRLNKIQELENKKD
jgi:ribose 5-phosphate isomerase B